MPEWKHEQEADGGVSSHESTLVQRRAFLTRGGLLAGGAAIGAAGAMARPAGAQVDAQTVDYVYLPISPTRVYDSRASGAGGPLFLNGTRTLFTGLDGADPPPLAITVNLTVTLTHQKGWLALFPGDETFNGTSSVNWFGDFQDIANNAFVGIPDDGSIKVRCGGISGAQADFVIDFIAASVGIDFAATASTSSVRAQLAQLAQPWTVG